MQVSRHRVDRILFLLVLLAGFLPAPSAVAQDAPPEGTEAGSGNVPVEEVAADSPRAALKRYLELCREGRYEDAAGYLKLDEGQRAEGSALARRLKGVLDRHIWFDLERVSPLSGGDPDDDLPEGTDEVGKVPGSSGGAEGVYLVRVTSETEARWVFSAGTVGRIEVWYGMLGDRWLREYLPEPLLRPGPADLLWWQWLALPVLILLAWGGGFFLGQVTRGILSRAAARTATTWDDVLLDRISGPLTLGWMLVVLFVAVPLLRLYEPAEVLVYRVIHAALFLIFFWSLLRVIDITGQILIGARWSQENAVVRSLLPLAIRVVKACVIVIAVIAVLSQFGYPVASLLAGLGLGGLAFALAAQKTVENLFGSVSIGLDQPIRVGDFVRIEDFVGTVESIGLRSTRIRTLDRTVITIPNGKLADMRLETFAVRDRVRLTTTIGLVYSTTVAQMRTVLEGLERVLREHPKIWPDAVVVRFAGFGASSLDIEIMCWFQTADYDEFRDYRQGVFLQFMEVVEAVGSSFAFPTRTVHLVQEGGVAPAPATRA